MKRREFITLLGGAARMAARGARAAAGQAADHRVPRARARCGCRAHGPPPSCSGCANSAGSRAAPSRSSIAGRRDAAERFAEIAAEFVRLKVDVIVTRRQRRLLAAKQATSIIPIVFAVGGDPVGSGLVASSGAAGRQRHRPVDQPTDLAGKRLELLREVVPGLRRWRSWPMSAIPAAVLEMREVQAAARTLGLEVVGARNSPRRGYRARLRRRSRAGRRRSMSSPIRS